MDLLKFKDKQGRYLTAGLFYETSTDKSTALYTLKDYDHEVNGIKYPSLKKLYLEMCDVTEYAFATEHMGSWNQWKR